MTRPVVVQHSFGQPGTGGPAGALSRLLGSRLASEYDFVLLQQQAPFGGLDVSVIRDWASRLRRLRPDMIHIRGLGNEGFHAAAAAKAAGMRRILVSVHGTHRDLQTHEGVMPSLRARTVSGVLEPLTLTSATHVATVCQYAADRPFLRRHRTKLVGVVPNGVSLPPSVHGPPRAQIRAAHGIDQQDPCLIFVGRLTSEKGLLTLVDALRRLGPRHSASEGQLHLLLVGDGPMRQTLESTPNPDHGIRIHLLGRRDDVGDLLAASDIFVFPSLHENLSNALLEAMAAGLPTIATNVGGNVEVLTDQVGLLVEPSHPEQLAAAIHRLAGDPSLRETLGTRSRARIAERYTMEHMVDGWDDVYRRVLES